MDYYLIIMDGKYKMEWYWLIKSFIQFIIYLFFNILLISGIP